MRIALLVAAAAALHAQEQDLSIVRRADEILSGEAVWNRHDTRECPPGLKTFSLYCALEKAIVDSGQQFEHRAKVMEHVRVAVELAAPNDYDHRLMGFNNDPEVTFADMKRMLRLAELRMSPDSAKGESTVKGRLVQNGSPVAGATVAIYCRDRKLPDRKEITAVTATDGSFAFHGLPGLEGWLVYAKMESIAARGAATPRAALTFPRETTAVRDLEIEAAHLLRGVVKLNDGRPIPEGSEIRLNAGCVGGCAPFDMPDSQVAALPADGRFLFRGVRGPVHLGIRVKSYGLHVDEPNGKPPGLDNFNERMRQMVNEVERVVRDATDVTIVLEPRSAPQSSPGRLPKR
jgi:hypothetical protein